MLTSSAVLGAAIARKRSLTQKLGSQPKRSAADKRRVRGGDRVDA